MIGALAVGQLGTTEVVLWRATHHVLFVESASWDYALWNAIPESHYDWLYLVLSFPLEWIPILFVPPPAPEWVELLRGHDKFIRLANSLLWSMALYAVWTGSAALWKRWRAR